MRRMSWSWLELQSFPADYVDVLMELLRREDAEHRRAVARARRR